jgi:hypothetical protein
MNMEIIVALLVLVVAFVFVWLALDASRHAK